MAIKRKLLPPIHPGNVLADILKEAGLTVNGLAMALRVPADRIGAILKGQPGITADMALRLSRYFGTSAQMWMKTHVPYLHFLFFGILSGFLLSGCAGRRASIPASPGQTPPVELRGLWVDGFHAGIRSSQEADALVGLAQRAHFNALFVQVRRRGDALYKKSFEPPVEDAAYDPVFDGLDYIVGAAHREGIEVHAWINAMPIWRDQAPPKDPRHVFNRHGPSQSGEQNWLNYSFKGEPKFPVGYFLDPGHPVAADYIVGVYLNIVRNYAIDGIHFDYIRYPETDERMPRGAPVGYNPTSLARFQKATGRTDRPAPDDEAWMVWRRQQVTQLVRRVCVEAKAINPRIKISAATIAWGKPPVSENDFLDTAPGQRIYQDWHSWLKEGILDLAVPMNYARESDPMVRKWFDGWILWEKRHKHGRQLAVGIGAYLNPPASNLAQVSRIRKPEGNSRVDGMSFYSYANLFSADPEARAEPSATLAPDRADYIVRGEPPAEGAFAAPARVPAMDWVENPKSGWLAGRAGDGVGPGIDGARISVRRAGWWPFRRGRETVTDGNGYFGFVGLSSGKYRLEFKGGTGKTEVVVRAGKVARADLRSLQ